MWLCRSVIDIRVRPSSIGNSRCVTGGASGLSLMLFLLRGAGSAGTWGASPHGRLEGGERERAAEQVALVAEAAVLRQAEALGLGLDALGDDLDSEVACHADDGLHDHRVR